jgi:hypothetical protein
MQIYNLFLAIFAAISALTTVKQQAFTELYFTNSASLPQVISVNQKYNFSFVIHNLEQATTRYIYEVSSGNTVLDQNSITLQNGENKTISENLGSIKKVRTEITVKLLNKNQAISFWID